MFETVAATAKPFPGVLLPAVRTIIESNHSGGAGSDIAALLSEATGFTYTAPNASGRKRDLGDTFPTGKFNASPYVYSYMFPVIDICTVEMPAKDAANAAFLQQTQYLLTQQLSNCKSNTQNQTELQAKILLATNETLAEAQDQNNISHVHREHHHSNQHPAHNNPEENTSAHGFKVRHSHHKHRSHTPSNHFDEAPFKRRANDEERENEREEIKEEVTLTDEFGRELRKRMIVKEVFHATHRDTHPQRESDR